MNCCTSGSQKFRPEINCLNRTYINKNSQLLNNRIMIHPSLRLFYFRCLYQVRKLSCHIYIYMCVRGFNSSICVYHFSMRFCNCSDIVVFFFITGFVTRLTRWVWLVEAKRKKSSVLYVIDIEISSPEWNKSL
jgi:hypothetical protein